MQRFVRLGLVALSSPGSDESGGNRRVTAQFVAEQLSTLAASFLDWSAEARTSLVREIKDLVARQVQEMGLATKKDLERLQRRLDRLEEERIAPGAPGGKASSAKSATRSPPKSARRAKRATMPTSSRVAGAAKPSSSGASGTGKASTRSKPAPGPG